MAVNNNPKEESQLYFIQMIFIREIDLENSGHFANLNKPHLFNRTLETFLNGLNEY